MKKNIIFQKKLKEEIIFKEEKNNEIMKEIKK
jgi:hypothetical protein